MLARSYIKDGETMAEAVMRYLRFYVTEELTDGWADLVATMVPAKVGPVPIPKFIIVRVVDALLPDRLLDLIEFGFRKTGMLPVAPTDRQLRPDNPFRARG